MKKTLKQGDGEKPPQDGAAVIEVNVHYTGWLLDGTKFDSSRDRGDLFSFKLGQGSVIKGWDLGVASMRTGEKARFRIREEYGYGKEGNAGIPGGAILVFDVELFSFERVQKKKWELSAEEKMAGATKSKAEGNTAFGAKTFDEALVHYKEALDYISYFYSDEEKKSIFSLHLSCNLNAAASCVKLEKWKDAIKYADDALKLEETNVKAMWRKAQALRSQGDTDDAKDVVIKAIRLDPKNKALRDELELIRKDFAAQSEKQKALFGTMFTKSLYDDQPDVKFWEGPLPKVFFDISVGGEAAGRIEFELFADKTPKTAENFRALCTGEKEKTDSGVKLHYKDTIFHRIIKGFMAQGGDTEDKNGSGGASIYGEKFPDENFARKHDQPYLLSMANSGKNTNGSQFFITFGPTPHLDGKHVVFGRVIQGQELCQKLEAAETGESDLPTAEIRVVDCGEIKAE